jgi:hypothetical protein
MRRGLLAAALVLALPLAAFAQDASVLSGWDDIEFAKALVANGYPDLAPPVLDMVERSTEFTDQSRGPVTAIRLLVAQQRASIIEDLLQRKDALFLVLEDELNFVDAYGDQDAAEDVRESLPELCTSIFDTVVEVMKQTTDDQALEAQRTQGAALFEKADQEIRKRIADLSRIAERSDSEENKLMAIRYNCPHSAYQHSLLFPRGSARRVKLCKSAMADLDEFFLDYEGGEDPTVLVYYAYVDDGLCLKEIGAPDEAIKMFDRTIALRESWGPADEKTGVWPIPSGFEDVFDLVAYATVEKMVVLREQKRFDEAVKTGKDWFSSMKVPFAPPQSMVLAKELAGNQLATDDATGARATAEAMIREDPDGWGGARGRELLGEAGK